MNETSLPGLLHTLRLAGRAVGRRSVDVYVQIRHSNDFISSGRDLKTIRIETH